MNATDRVALLSKWIKPSSANEQDRQDRAVRMVKAAMGAWPMFEDISYVVYAKGSYKNNTNVRLDSDVDIVVENHECRYYDYYQGIDAQSGAHASPYEGVWTPSLWRSEVGRALSSAFPGEVDTSGVIALTVPEKSGSRPSIDVVPSFDFIRYYNAERTLTESGSKVFTKSGDSIINWPTQQYENGKKKNLDTGGRYKNYARTLKNAENQLVKEGAIEELPSYFMECLAWNVPNDKLSFGSLDQGFRATLVWMWQHLNDDFVSEDWDEPNRLKYLFRGNSKWTRDDAKGLVLETWRHLGYTS